MNAKLVEGLTINEKVDEDEYLIDEDDEKLNEKVDEDNDKNDEKPWGEDFIWWE